jgi:hypothetical protein
MHATPKSAVASTVAIDLAKDVFELAFTDANAHILERRRLTRSAFSRAFDNSAPLRIVVEACGSAHYWARRFQRGGHHVELLPAHDVRPCARTCARTYGATRPIARMRPACSKRRVAIQFVACRSRRRNNKGSRGCIACVSSTRRSAPRRSTSCAAFCASSA